MGWNSFLIKKNEHFLRFHYAIRRALPNQIVSGDSEVIPSPRLSSLIPKVFDMNLKLGRTKSSQGESLPYAGFGYTSVTPS